MTSPGALVCTIRSGLHSHLFSQMKRNVVSHRVKEPTVSLKSYQRLPLSGYLFFFIVVPVERGVGAHCDDKLLLSSCLQTFLLNFKGCHHDELIADWMLWGDST